MPENGRAGASPPPSIGSYRLVQPLGSGGMSSVFRAVHSTSGHEVAVKILPRSLAKNGTMLQRFLREAKNAETLQHPNIVAIYDRGSEQGRYYLVLEYVPGGDLHDRVRENGPLPVAEAVRTIRSAAEGLDYAAGRGLIHRDIKPANLLVSANGAVKVIDLGLALQTIEEDERVTRDGTTVGTVDYMAPEQARDSRATSIRSDIYSLGCTFYFLLTGNPPFPGGDVPEKLRRHATEAPPDVRAVRPDVPEALSKLIRKMMAKKPEKRFPDYAALIRAIDELPPLPNTPPGEAPLLALVDDDDDDDAPPVALIDDDDDDEMISRDFAVGPGRGSTYSFPSTVDADRIDPRPRSRPAAEPAPVAAGDVNFGALAEMEHDEEATRSTRRPKKTAPRPPTPVPHPIAGHGVLEEEVYGLKGGATGMPLSRRVEERSLKDMIVLGLTTGIAVVVVGFGLYQLVAWEFGLNPTEAVAGEGTGDDGLGEGSADGSSSSSVDDTDAIPDLMPAYRPDRPGGSSGGGGRDRLPPPTAAPGMPF